MNPNITWLVFEMTCGIIAAPLSFAGFIYLFVVQQYDAAVWILVTTILISGLFHLNMLLFRQKLDEWYDPYALENLKALGIVMFCASVVASGIYVSIAFKRHESFTLQSHYASAIASMTCGFFGSYFFVLARRYKRYVELCSPPLLATNRTWRRF